MTVAGGCETPQTGEELRRPRASVQASVFVIVESAQGGDEDEDGEDGFHAQVPLARCAGFSDACPPGQARAAVRSATIGNGFAIRTRSKESYPFARVGMTRPGRGALQTLSDPGRSG